MPRTNKFIRQNDIRKEKSYRVNKTINMCTVKQLGSNSTLSGQENDWEGLNDCRCRCRYYISI